MVAGVLPTLPIAAVNVSIAGVAAWLDGAGGCIVVAASAGVAEAMLTVTAVTTAT